MLTAAFGQTAIRMALAMLLDIAALVIWNIGTRSPVRVFLDVRAGLQHRSNVMRGCVRFITGALAVALAVSVSAPITGDGRSAGIIDSWELVTALIVEQLIGPDLRAQPRASRDSIS